MAEKNKERLKEITDSIKQGIQSLFQNGTSDPDGFRAGKTPKYE